MLLSQYFLFCLVMRNSWKNKYKTLTNLWKAMEWSFKIQRNYWKKTKINSGEQKIWLSTLLLTKVNTVLLKLLSMGESSMRISIIWSLYADLPQKRQDTQVFNGFFLHSCFSHLTGASHCFAFHRWPETLSPAAPLELQFKRFALCWLLRTTTSVKHW